MLTTKTDTIQTGRYRHYKGGEYNIIGVATHSETGELLVIYQALYGERGLWARPYSMFISAVRADGQEMPRFAYCGE